MRTFSSPDEILDAVGEELGPSEWITIDQDRIDKFADATGDHQWIHVDTERAKNGPFGTTIAHGFLTLTLLPEILGSLYSVEGVGLALNYGLNKVRMPSPVPSGSKIRGTSTVSDAQEVDGGVQVVWSTVIEIEGASKPAVVAESIVRLIRKT